MNLFPEAFANEGVAPAPQGDMSFLIIMVVFMLGFYIFVLRPQN
jgi:preprotein translocase subunit YajC